MKRSAPAVRTVIVLAAIILITGCGKSGPTMSTVKGRVTYTDGTTPKGAVQVISFEPTIDSKAEIRKMASGAIEADGTYEAFTLRPGDGVLYGKYKVIFDVLDSYRTGVSLIDKKFTRSETTPFEVVIDSPTHEFDFEIEKAAGG